jgi:hypothetical protein
VLLGVLVVEVIEDDGHGYLLDVGDDDGVCDL